MVKRLLRGEHDERMDMTPWPNHICYMDHGIFVHIERNLAYIAAEFGIEYRWKSHIGGQAIL